MKTKLFRGSLAVALALLMMFPLIPTGAAAQDTHENPVAVSEVLAAIATGYQNTDNDWAAISMAARGRASDVAGGEILKNARHTYENGTSTDLARTIITLTALGVDATHVYSGRGNAYLDFIERLGAQTPSQLMTAIFGLQALDSGDYNDAGLALTRQSCIDFLLNAKMEPADGQYAWITWEDSPDIDTTAMAITALAPYYDDDAAVKATVDGALACLAESQDSAGHYENSMSTSMVTVALATLGLNPAASTGDFAANGHSVLDGLLTFRIGNLFGYDSAETACPWSTEQAFRALAAYQGYLDCGQNAYNIYRFGPGTGDGTNLTGETIPDDTPAGPGPDPKIHVFLTLRGLGGNDNSEVWLSGKAVSVAKGATVSEVIIKALGEAGYAQSGARDGYVRSVTTPGGFTLAEMHNGFPNSGWLYKVNSQLPTVGMAAHIVTGGDHILLYFTKDFTKDPDAGAIPDENPAGGEKAPDGENDPAEEPVADPETEATPSPAGVPVWTNPFADVRENDWFHDVVAYINTRQLMAGVETDRFAPRSPMTRAMLVTVLYRCAGEPAVGATHRFSDVTDNAWYRDAVVWAAENRIVSGYGHGLFGTRDNVTREQLAAILRNYGAAKGLDVSATADLSAYTDAGAISPWAREALAWAAATDLIRGRGADTLAPGETATRAEVAAILMRYLENNAA